MIAYLQRLRESTKWLKAPLALALGLRLLVFVVADALARLRSRAQFGGMLNGWQKKDAVWYLSIAQNGYHYSPHAQSSVNFFPLYPLLIRVIQPLIGLIAWHDSYLVSGLLISWVAFAAACGAIYRLAWDHFGQTTATGALLLLATYPFSFYYGAPFTESLYLLLAALALLAIERRWWWLAGTVALLAGAERPTGLLIGACVALAYALDWRRTRHPLRRDMLALALTPLGAAAYALYCWARFGDPLAYVQTSRAGWHGGYLQSGALRMAWRTLLHPTAHWVFTVYVLLFVGFVASLPLVLRLFGPVYALYTFASLAAPILDFPTLQSLGRYTSVVFPTFIVLAYMLRRWPQLQGMVAGVSLALLAMFAYLFIIGYGLS